MNKLDFPTNEKGTTELSVKTAIYVPSTKYDKKITPKQFAKRIIETRKFLSKTFGGSTSIQGTGSWLDKNKLIKEDVVIVESFTTKPLYLEHDKLLENFVKSKLDSWKQAAISVEYRGKLYIIN